MFPLLCFFSFLFSQNLGRNSLVIGDERLYLKKMAIMGERGYSTLRILKHKILKSLEARKKNDASGLELKSMSICLHILKP